VSDVVLSARGVTQRFGDVVALEDLDFEVKRGEFVVLVGASGCGKSTLLNLFAGFDRPTEGRVELMGEPVVGVEPRCGMVFQNYALFPWLTVRGNIAFGPRLRGEVADERVTELIRTVGIEGFDDHYPAQLSGGMKQRVALARTLANDPEVLLCDEPFAALDAMTRQVLQEELTRIAAETGKTVLFITHSIDEALLMSDRVVVMTARPGRIKTDAKNPLPRPRSAKQQLTPDYQEAKRGIWETVQEEVLANIHEPAPSEPAPRSRRPRPPPPKQDDARP
jgi:NitT/TauT family transport system ATP-binding protein